MLWYVFICCVMRFKKDEAQQTAWPRHFTLFCRVWIGFGHLSRPQLPTRLWVGIVGQLVAPLLSCVPTNCSPGAVFRAARWMDSLQRRILCCSGCVLCSHMSLYFTPKPQDPMTLNVKSLADIWFSKALTKCLHWYLLTGRKELVNCFSTNHFNYSLWHTIVYNTDLYIILLNPSLFYFVKWFETEQNINLWCFFISSP